MLYKNKEYKVYTGPKGGQYILINNKKHYVSTSNKSNKKKIKTTIKKDVKICCCCGKELNESDCRYYDLIDYCPNCALSDGIITSLD